MVMTANQGFEGKTVYRRGDSGPARVVKDATEDVTVYRTKAYEQFEFAPENRPLYPGHVANLRQSIKENGYLKEMPIQVIRSENGKLLITDGQHRFTVCKELDVEVYYVIKDDVARASETIRIINAYAKAWKDEDYLRHFLTLGYPAYVKLHAFMQQFDLPTFAALTVLSGCIRDVKNLRMPFRTGDLKLSDEDFSEATEVMEKVNAIRSYHNRLATIRKDRAFLGALITMVKSKHYDHERMMHTLERGLAYIVKCTNSQHYLDMLTDVYNRGLREKNRTVFTKKGSQRLNAKASEEAEE
jgi:hypothetical protein